MKKTILFIFLAFVVGLTAVPAADEQAPFLTIEEDLRNLLKVPLQERTRALLDIKTSEGFKNHRGNFSEKFRKLDDDTYQNIFIERIASRSTLTVNRSLLTLKRDGKRDWKVVEEELLQTYDKMKRSWPDPNFRSFESMSFELEGLKITGGRGHLFLKMSGDKVDGIVAAADDMTYVYKIPDRISAGGYYGSVKERVEDRYKSILDFTPKHAEFGCDEDSCLEILKSAFRGLSDDSIPEFSEDAAWLPSNPPSGVNSHLATVFNKDMKDWRKDLKQNAFLYFSLPLKEDRKFVFAAAHKNRDDAVYVRSDSYQPEEVSMGMYFPDSELVGTLLSYYSEDTWNGDYDIYELERRPDLGSRQMEVYSLSGEIDCALEDPEILKGRVHFALNLKQDVTELVYGLASIKQGEGEAIRNPALKINRVEMDGEELLVAPAGSSGVIVFPEEIKAGTRINLYMDFINRGLYKLNHAYTGISRGGWLPFVQFTDKVEKLELVVRTPSEYKTLGIGHLVEKSTKDGVTTTSWKADSPVTFPTIIFGKYVERGPSEKTPDVIKSDGTVVPVMVHVDEVSMGNWEIRPKQLVPIANQAASALDYYRRISGVDYPFKKLDIVNDPAPAMYGQAPASLIYLGSLVFRGEGIHGVAGGGTSTAKFLKSVVAHEVGHQWWGAVINNKNMRNYWFVETMAEYFSALWLEAHYGKQEYQEQVDEWYRRIMEIEQLSSVQRATSDYGGEFPGAAYQASVYNKGPYAFHILRQTFGDEKFFQFIKGFTQDLAAIGEITTLDIQRAAEKNLGGIDANGDPYNADLGWFFDQWIRGIGIPEYRFKFTSRPNEEGGWVVEGTVTQRIMMGNKINKEVMPDQYFRGVVPITVVAAKGREYQKRLIVEGKKTSFRLLVPERPVEINLNQRGEILAHEVLVNR